MTDRAASTAQIQPERIAVLNREPDRRGSYVLYWMQQAQRAECNHALEYAVQAANERNVPLLAVFGLMADYPEANARHYRFLLEGLADAQAALARRGIRMVVASGDPADVALRYGGDASLIVCDRGYLRHQRAWRERVADAAPCRVVQVETDVVVPVNTVSGKREYAARTIRPKLHRLWDAYLVDLRTTPLRSEPAEVDVDEIDLGDVDAVLSALGVDASVPPVPAFFKGGTHAARQRLDTFIESQFGEYTAHRNRPETDDISQMSPYLHFGHISPLYLALRIRESQAPRECIESYVEELIVRRELAHNFVAFTPNYDEFACLPAWARQTLRTHAKDAREHVYTEAELAASQTHDPYWNAAMTEMRVTGFMHNYMRMYWGKKILEWTPDPETAYRAALGLNNRYFLDGRDPNSYANVGWLFGLHDRPWQERPIFGTVRYMNANGLRRKCDIDGYVEKVRRMAG